MSQQAILRALELTRQMLEEAENDRWSTVVEIEHQREELFYKMTSPDESIAEEDITVLNEILELNNRLVEIGKNIRASFISEIQGAVKGVNAISEYNKNK